MDLGSIEDVVNVLHGVVDSIDSGTAGRRERIATAALQGLLAHGSSCRDSRRELAQAAVEYADALVRALDQVV